jgi:uncharacterized iron-regulated membrane protein
VPAPHLKGLLWIFDWRKLLVYTHRWLGIAGCVLFIAWFLSGIVMMYARMPGLAEEERLARAQPLDLSRATISPADAAEMFGLSGDRMHVGMLQGRPVYRFGTGRSLTIVYADTGEFFDGMDKNGAADVARAYAPGYAGPFHYDAYLTEPDQWTLQAGTVRPLHRFALDDAEATRLYVSEVTGDVVLRTTRRERFWGYLGPVMHWVYFTPLRRNGLYWSEFVIWSSLIGCVMCVSGLLWGLWRLSPRSQYRLKRVPSATPYSGWMKWHHYAGLLFGAVTLTWTYSGLLSMGPFDWFSSPPMTREQREASAGGPMRLDLLTLESMRAAMATLSSSFVPRELEAMQFQGEPFWAAYRPPSSDEATTWMHAGLLPRKPLPTLEHQYVSAEHPERGAFKKFDDDAMFVIAKAAMPGVAVRDAVWLQDYDGYYYDSRASLSLPVLRVRYADEHSTWLYFDPQRGRLVERSVSVTRLRRWLYQGFHSLDFPAIYFRRPLWDAIVIALSIGGTVLSVTTLLPAWRRLRRQGRRIGGPVTAWLRPRPQ